MPYVPGPNRNARFESDLTRSPSHRRMGAYAYCAVWRDCNLPLCLSRDFPPNLGSGLVGSEPNLNRMSQEPVASPFCRQLHEWCHGGALTGLATLR